MSYKSFLNNAKIIVLASILTIGITYAYAQVPGWTPPPVNPPAGNTAAPVNVGGEAQVKGGGFGAANITAGNLLKGVSLQITGGNPGPNKILTATASSGVATWKSLSDIQNPDGDGGNSSIPPVCTGSGKALQWTGTAWSCVEQQGLFLGAEAYTCIITSPVLCDYSFILPEGTKYVVFSALSLSLSPWIQAADGGTQDAGGRVQSAGIIDYVFDAENKRLISTIGPINTNGYTSDGSLRILYNSSSRNFTLRGFGSVLGSYNGNLQVFKFYR